MVAEYAKLWGLILPRYIKKTPTVLAPQSLTLTPLKMQLGPDPWSPSVPCVKSEQRGKPSSQGQKAKEGFHQDPSPPTQPHPASPRGMETRLTKSRGRSSQQFNCPRHPVTPRKLLGSPYCSLQTSSPCHAPQKRRKNRREEGSYSARTEAKVGNPYSPQVLGA